MGDLLLNQLKAAISDLLEARGVKASVHVKVNHRGEQVVAAILNEICPACEGTGRKRYPPDDDAKTRDETGV